MSLNVGSSSIGYQLGRLFAILENLQYQANGNTTIRAKYFSSAMATPRVAYTNLLKLAQAHITKGEYAMYWDRQIAAIVNRLDGIFPATLSMEEQGMFILGFYQQKQAQFEEQEERRCEKSGTSKMEDIVTASDVIEEGK